MTEWPCLASPEVDCRGLILIELCERTFPHFAKLTAQPDDHLLILSVILTDLPVQAAPSSVCRLSHTGTPPGYDMSRLVYSSILWDVCVTSRVTIIVILFGFNWKCGFNVSKDILKGRKSLTETLKCSFNHLATLMVSGTVA